MTDDLLDEVLSDDGRQQGRCTVALTLDSIGDEVLRSKFWEVVDTPQARHAAIARALHRRGIMRVTDGKPLTQLQLSVHRNGNCACG